MLHPGLGIDGLPVRPLVLCIGLFLLLGAWFLVRHRRGTLLRGPPSTSWIFGATKALVGSPQGVLQYECWAEEYGSVYSIPCELGQSCVVLCDPKAVQHFYARETREYVHTYLLGTIVRRILGCWLFSAEGEDHKRHKRALAPAFYPAVLEDVLPIFYSYAHKVADGWDRLTTVEGCAEIDVRDWMTKFAFDTIGTTGFGLDLGTLRGKRSAVLEGVNSLRELQTNTIAVVQFTISLVCPAVLKIPTSFGRTYNELNAGLDEFVHEIRETSRVDGDKSDSEVGGNTLIHRIFDKENGASQMSMTDDELRSQLKLMLLTGYVTAANCLTWCLVELAHRPHLQHKVREEISMLSSAQPSLDQLTNELPYLDAVIHETLRLHPPLNFTTRVASQDDVISLSSPVTTTSGALTDRVFVSKGQVVTVPIFTMNTASRFWGPDAKEFNPDRFLDEERIPKQVPGHRHILTFVHGQRMCPGRHYALAEIKVLLFLLIRDYSFEPLDGPQSKVNVVRDMASVPRVSGGDGVRVPLRVRRLDRTPLSASL